MMKKIISILFCATNLLTAAASTLSGIIVDREGNPVEFASVRVSTASDSIFVKGAVADSLGHYSVAALAPGNYIASASCIGFATVSQPCTIKDATPVTLDFTLSESSNRLREVVATTSRFVRTAEGLTVIPSKEQTKHSWTGYELIRNLMIPGLNVNASSGEVAAFGGAVSLYIDGMPADFREVQQLRPGDVERVQYFEAPTGKYAGDNAALNFIMKKRTSGGYISLDALQRFGYNSGDYNLAGKFFQGNTQYTLFAGADYTRLTGAELTRHESINFPSGSVGRDYSTEESREKKNSQYAQLRVRNKNKKRTLRATFNFVRSAQPEDFNSSLLTYSGLDAAGTFNVASSSATSSRGLKYSLGLSGSFNLPNGHFIEASASASASRNNYNYIYSESASSPISSDTKENYYDFSGSFSYGMKFHRGNSLVFKATENYNVSSATYSGTNTSWQHLWSSECIFFAEYSHPVGRIGSLRLSPGFSAQSYRVHGLRQSNPAGPRAQLVLALQPARNQFAQLMVFYGNSYPQLSMMSGATQQVDMLQLRRGNPDLKQTRITKAMAVYGASVGRVTFQLYGIFNAAWRLPMADYFFEDGMLVQSFYPYGHWRQYDTSLSVTWTPSGKFNARISGGYLYNGYFHNLHVSAACWKASADVAWYMGDFALNASVETPQKIAGYDRIVTRTIWNYKLSLSWTHNKLRAEAGTHNLFMRHPYYTRTLSTPAYDFRNTSYSPSDRSMAYVKLAWSLDFGKKTSHDKNNVDRNIGSGILRAD